jgi:hypothetical protein
MGARSRVNTYQRRPARDAGYLIGRTGVIVPEIPPLPASTVDYLHSLQRVTLDGSNNVQTWASAGAKYSPTQGVAGQRPAYGGDGSNFKGKSVVQAAVTGSKGLISPAGVQIFANGSRPYILTIARLRAMPAGTQGMSHFADAGVGGNYPGIYGNPGNVQMFVTGGTTVTYVTAGAGVPGFWEMYLDAAGASVIALNGTIVATAGAAGTITAATVKMSIGCNASGANFTDSSFAFQLTATAVPTAPERAAMLAWSRAYWGTP